MSTQDVHVYYFKDGTTSTDWRDLSKLLHRENGPAQEYANGDKHWWRNDIYLEVIPKQMLVNYMKANDLTLAHLLTDPDPVVRDSASLYDWSSL